MDRLAVERERETQLALLGEMYPNWREITESKRFKAFLRRQPGAAWSLGTAALDVAGMIRRFNLSQG